MNNFKIISAVITILSSVYFVEGLENDTLKVNEQRGIQQDLLTNTSNRVPVSLRADGTSNISLPDSETKGGFWPIVSYDRNENQSKVDVHVPIVFDMTKDDSSKESKLDLSVLSGLVTVNREKARQSNGSLVGPVKVTIFGIPVYSGQGISARTNSNFGQQASATGEAGRGADRRSVLIAPIENMASRLESSMQRDALTSISKINEKVFSSLVSTLNGITRFLEQRAYPKWNAAVKGGPPLENGERIVSMASKANFTNADFQPTIPINASFRNL